MSRLNSCLSAACALLLLWPISHAAQDSLKSDAGQKPGQWLGQASKKLSESETLECDAALKVIEAPPNQKRKYEFHVGTTHYHFRIKGTSRVYWKERWDGKGDVATRETWYEGNLLYVRASSEPKKLTPIEVGEWEGGCIKRSLVEGGVLGWRLGHRFDGDEAGGGYVAVLEVKGMREEKLNDRAAVVLDLSIGFGFGPERARVESGTARVWIDREKHLLLQRDMRFELGTEEKPAVLRAIETYSNWKFDAPMDNATFHVEGMGPADPLVDAPADPELFEVEQTRNLLGFAVQDFPKPQGPASFDELPADSPAFAFQIAPRKLSGPEPPAWYETRSSIVIKKPDGSEIEAYGGDDDPKKFLPGHGFDSTRTNRRHLSGIGARNIYIGKRLTGKLQPSLFFRDAGSHGPCYDFALASKDRCHLAIADVDMGQFNRFKLYWLVGDLKAGKWTEAWLVDRLDQFTSWAHPRSAAWKDKVHLIWNWADGSTGDKAQHTGIYHVQWNPAGFGRKLRVFKGEATSFDMAVDPDSGQLLVVFNTGKGAFVTSKPAQGTWTRPARLHPMLTDDYSVSVQAGGKGCFIVRTKYVQTREWLLTCK
jgi:hypothetical protein